MAAFSPRVITNPLLKRSLSAVSLLAALCLTAVAPVLADDELAQGKLLLADKRLRDPNFAETVVLIVTYDKDGAIGLILNREGEVPVSGLLKGVKDAAKMTDLAFEGGPVDPKSVVTLFRSPTPQPRARHIGGEIYTILNRTLLEEILSNGAGPDQLRFYLGFANWGPGQLEKEVDAGAWRILPGAANTVFDPNPDSLWNRLVRTMDQKVVKAIPPPDPQKHFRPDATHVRPKNCKCAPDGLGDVLGAVLGNDLIHLILQP
jgi:putative transcriptional regulator